MTTVTPLPTPPNPTETPTAFNSHAFAWVSALTGFTGEVNSLAGELTAASAAAVDASETAVAAAGTASGHASTATTQAGLASGYATTAETQAGIATTQAGIATTQAGLASGYASSASADAGTATTKAGEATSAAGTATTKAGEATTAAGTATTKAGEATTAAGTAITQAGLATSAAETAVTKAGEALSSANAAAASYDSFDDRYLGSKSSNPTVDNDGNALLTGALYWNSSAAEMRVWSGSAWSAAYVPSGSYLTTSAVGVTVAGLDGSGKVPAAQLPSYVDDVIEAATSTGFPGTGETGKIYVAIDTGKIYRWSGSVYVEISASTGTVTSVAASVPTGLTISGSPVTTSGTLAIAYDTGYAIPTTSKQTNWDSAYGWGNHASAGYLTTATASSTYQTQAGMSSYSLTSHNHTGTYQPVDADLTAIAALSGTSGLLKKTAADTWSLDTSTYLTSSAIGSTVQAYDADLDTWATKTAPSGTVVGTTDTQTLTNKTLTGYTETVYNLSGTAIDPANGTIQYKTLSANTTFTENLADGQCVTLMLNPATYTTTWPTMTWIGSVASTAPTLIASVYNCITIFQFGGTVYGKYEGRV